MERISVSSKSFVDENGRERIFNGINLVYKGNNVEGQRRRNYIPSDWNDELFDKFENLGINLVRLGLIWDGVEPQPDVYDEEYLDFMSDIADKLKSHRIYFYLDMHQDLYSHVFGGDGAPMWAIISDSYKYKPPKFVWAEGYFFSKAVHRSFDHFWNNDPILGRGLQDRFADMWQHVASKFKDKDNLLGFDIFNEPYPGTNGGKAFKAIVKSGVKTVMSKKVNKVKAVKNMIQGDTFTEALAVIDDRDVFRSLTKGGDLYIKNFDVDKYYPFFRRVSSAIRQVTDRGIIIMENCYYSNLNIPCSTPRLRYDDDHKETNLAFAPHGYDLTVDTVLTNTASNKRVDTIFDEHKKTQERLYVHVIVGEWGGMVPGSEEYPHLEHLLEKFDNNKWSQTYWAYSGGFEDTKIMDIIARPYPMAVPGTIEKYGYNRKSNTFTLKFTATKEEKTRAIIYSPKKPDKINASGKTTVRKIGDDKGALIYLTVGKGENFIEFKS